MRKFGLLAALMLLATNAFAQSTRPPFVPIWASGAAPTTDIVQPSNSYITAGWPLSSTPPSRQYFNWVLNRGTWGVDYLLHRGIADWDSSTVYAQGDVVQYGAVLYRNIVSNNTGNAPSAVSTQWTSIASATRPVGDNSLNVATTEFVHSNSVPLGGAFSLLGGQISASQVPLAAVNQYQSFLSINYAQLTGVPVSTANAPNTIVFRDSSGNAFTNYFNQTSPANENPTIDQVAVSGLNQGTYWRKASLGFFQSQMNLSSIGGQVSAGQVPSSAVTQYSPQIFAYNPTIAKANPGCVTIPGGIVIIWGNMNPNGNTITVAFACGGFANAALNVVANGSSIPTQTNVLSWTASSFTVHNTGGSGNYIAIGY